jgi:hypothetical protein
MVAKGEYVVKEDGLQFEHSTMVPDQPCSPDEFVVRFRYVHNLWSPRKHSAAMKLTDVCFGSEC